MPANVSTATVRARALALAGLPASNFGDTAALNAEIVADVKALHDDLILAGGAYQTSSESVALSAGLQAYFFTATDVYRIRSVHVVGAGSRQVSELEQWSPANAAETLALPSQRGRPRWFELTAALQGLVPADALRVWPTPDASYTALVQYIATPTITSSGGEFLFYAGNGWETALAYSLAAKLLVAEEADASMLMAERERAWAKAIAVGAARHAGPPERTPIRPPLESSRARGSVRYPTFRLAAVGFVRLRLHGHLCAAG